MKQHALQRRADRQRVLDRLLARELRLAQDQWHLEQRQRVALAALDQQLGHAGRQRPVGRVEQGECGGQLESSERHTGQAGALRIEDAPGRVATSIATPSPRSRRAANSSASAEDASSH